MTDATDRTALDALPYDPTAPLRPSGNLRRRTRVSGLVSAVCSASALFAAFKLVLMVIDVATRGAKALSFHFITHDPVGLGSGGIGNALAGTGVIVAFAAVLALPVGILCGVYLTEFAGSRSRTGRALRLVLDLLQGLPTVIVGVVVYGLLVATTHQETGVAGSVALAIVMLPLVARASQEVLLLVPDPLREATDALGVDRWRGVVGVILPAALGGIATGAILAVARAAGETAPLLFVNSVYNPSTTQLNIFSSQGVPSIPLFIFTHYDLPSPQAVDAVWGAAFALLMFILAANVLARLLLARTRARMRA
jgi:phosphate transport system permease protein